MPPYEVPRLPNLNFTFSQMDLYNKGHCDPAARLRRQRLEPFQPQNITSLGYKMGEVGSNCVWYFEVPAYNSIKIDITYWQYIGPRDANCSFGGFFVLSLHSNMTIHQNELVLCGKLSETSKSINFTVWSSTHRVGIVVGLFSPYSMAKLRVVVSLSSCLVYSNPCRSPVRQRSTVFSRHTLWQDKSFKPAIHDCVIIQQLEENKMESLVSCHIRLKATICDFRMQLLRAVYFPYNRSKNAIQVLNGSRGAAYLPIELTVDGKQHEGS